MLPNTALFLARELKAVGIDISFAPVLDLDYGNSDVIGDRAWHQDAAIVGILANAQMQGMRSAGMPAIAKHFPGHGYVSADSHHDCPIDKRLLSDINKDLIPFKRLIADGLWGVMPAHVVYEQYDSYPACFSSYWLQQVLRQQLGFKGMIF